MRRIRKFLALTSRDRRLLLQSVFLLVRIRMSFRLRSFEDLRCRLSHWARPRTDAAPAPDFTQRAVWAVTTASRKIPSTQTCLFQALALRVLLGRQNIPCTLHIGVARDEANEFKAHAWVESGGDIVIGETSDLADYTRLPPLEGEIL
jgi:hypothetical protein